MGPGRTVEKRQRSPEDAMKTPCVYMMASRRAGAIYIGVTSDLVQRVWQHKQNLVAGHSRMYATHILVWYEVHEEMASALLREKRLKKWYRAWKVALIEQENPEWRDLYDGLL